MELAKTIIWDFYCGLLRMHIALLELYAGEHFCETDEPIYGSIQFYWHTDSVTEMDYSTV